MKKIYIIIFIILFILVCITICVIYRGKFFNNEITKGKNIPSASSTIDNKILSEVLKQYDDMNKALKTHNIKFCDQYQGEKKDQCILNFADALGNYEYCAIIGEAKSRARCEEVNKMKISLADNNWKLCQELTITELRSACIQELAATSSGRQLCLNLN